MKLTSILDEISVGYLQNDEKSRRLKQHADEVRSVLEKQNSVFENRSLSFQYTDIEKATHFDRSMTFFQGSYATHTGIKSVNYEVDADIAFYINETFDFSLRDKIYLSLVSALSSKYEVSRHKPCISIDFRNGYKIDVAVYSRATTNTVMEYHNSISGYEKKTKAMPKEIVQTFSSYLKDNEIKRPIIRLAKHFIKTSTSNLNIVDENRIPSIAVILLAIQYYRPKTDTITEASLYNELSNFINLCYMLLVEGNITDLSFSDLLIYNPLYKVKDFNDVKKVIIDVRSQLAAKNYAQLITKGVFDSVTLRESRDDKPSLLGTLGLSND